MLPGTVDSASSPEVMVATVQPEQEPPPGREDSCRTISKLEEKPIDLGLIRPETVRKSRPEELEGETASENMMMLPKVRGLVFWMLTR